MPLAGLCAGVSASRARMPVIHWAGRRLAGQAARVCAGRDSFYGNDNGKVQFGTRQGHAAELQSLVEMDGSPSF